MSFSKSDLSELKWSITALLLSISLASFLLSLSEDYLAHSLKERESAQKQLTDARTQLISAQNDKENMSSYALEYNALLAQKVIGNEQRLDWLEGLEKLRQQGSVIDFKYTINPLQGFTPNPPIDAGNFQLSHSSMSMQIDLLHEEQLLHLFNNLHNQINGWFMLDGCTLSRPEAKYEFTSLKADCTGSWFTMKNKSAP